MCRHATCADMQGNITCADIQYTMHAGSKSFAFMSTNIYLHAVMKVTHSIFHWKCGTPTSTKSTRKCPFAPTRVESIKSLTTYSNYSWITIWICTARYQGIWVSRFGGFRGGALISAGSVMCQVVSKMLSVSWVKTCEWEDGVDVSETWCVSLTHMSMVF